MSALLLLQWNAQGMSGPHTRLNDTAIVSICVRIFTHCVRISHIFKSDEPACWSLNFMHFQTSVIRLVDRLT